MAQAARVSQVPLSPGDYLGPAEVLAVEPFGARVALPDGQEVRATLALALPYQPVVGDVLLVIAKGEDRYAIGVLRGSGTTVLALHGDVELTAVEGKLRLTGERGVELRGPEVEVYTGTLRMVADAVVQTFTSVAQRVQRLLTVHAGETHTLVDGGTFAQSKSAAILTEETVTINGKEIHLG